jgi:ribose 5-phosphate isomerase B
MAVIALGADHAGFLLKEHLKAWLGARGAQVHDHGTFSTEPVDYPDVAARVAEAVTSAVASRGVLVCGTGLGMAIVANKFPGIRAAACADVHAARLSREHNDTNVLALGARITGRDTAVRILEAWLDTAFEGGRHARRLDKIAALEEKAHASSR